MTSTTGTLTMTVRAVAACSAVRSVGELRTVRAAKHAWCPVETVRGRRTAATMVRNGKDQHDCDRSEAGQRDAAQRGSRPISMAITPTQ